MADYFETGFTVREASWHGKETVLAEHPESWDDARMAAGLMWEPTFEPLYRKTKTDGGKTVYVETDGGKLVVRDDTNEPLGVVRGRFELLTHADMGPIMEAILGDPNAKYETAGSVREGRQVYAVVRLDEPYSPAKDKDGFGDKVATYPYLALLNSHDGTGSCKVTYTQVRVVCWNTVQAAEADGDRHGQQFVFRHTAGMKERIDEAKTALAGARAEALRWRTLAEQLHTITINQEQTLTFLNEFLPEPPAGTTSERVRANVARDRGRFMVLLESSTNSRQAGTGLGLVNAAVEYLDHVRGAKNSDSYMGRQLLRPEPLKAKAVKLVRELATAGA